MPKFRHGDPLDDFDELDRQQAKRLASRPVCLCCLEPIQDDEAFHHPIKGIDLWLCHSCIELNTEEIEVEE